uniref:WIYLD domain-containing protein n=1 Tax=Ananas comosus var. bracteatus TaxID=296719 RepID=A0A6V7PJ69_ANACO|nr:unnamed protein product [Ananas comosus var. bracteatus]
MVSNTERARAALNAMKALGFPKKVATPVLKNLLMLYGGKWELIEDENYRALADAVLDMQVKLLLSYIDTTGKQKDTAVDDEPESHRGTLRIREDDQVASPSAFADETPLKRPKLEVDEVPESQTGQQDKDSKKKDTAVDDEPELYRTRAKIREEDQEASPSQHTPRAFDESMLGTSTSEANELPKSSSLVVYQKENSSANGTLETAVCLKEPKVEPGTMNLQKNDAVVQHSALAGPIDEPLENNSSKLESPLAVLCPVEERVVQGQGSEDGSLRSIPTLPTNVTENDSKQHEDRAHVEEYIIAQSKNGARDGIWFAKCAVPNNSAYLNENACGNDKTGRAKKAMQSAVGGVSNNMPECSMALWQSNLALCDVRPTHDINDISKGEERVRISVVNEISSEKYPPSFSYIPQNVVFKMLMSILLLLGSVMRITVLIALVIACLLPCHVPVHEKQEENMLYTYDGLVKKQFLDECISMNRTQKSIIISIAKIVH